MTHSKVAPADAFAPSPEGALRRQQSETDITEAKPQADADEIVQLATYDDIGLTMEEMAAMEGLFTDPKKLAMKRRAPRGN